MLEVLNLNENNCADCYKCIRTCSVKAITYANNTAEIVHDECILCGNCFVACPQKAKQVRNDVPRVKEAIAAGKHVVCSLAPSFIADFRIRSLDVMTDALKRLGFAEVQETAVGAQLVSDEYARIMREGKQRVLISSCCPSINMLIQKYYPTMLPHLAKVLTPMQAHCKAIKEQNPEAFTVFIGPCIAKKAEADESPYTDIALTYDELRDWLAAEHIELPTDHVEPGDGKRARFYPATGGVLKATDKVEGYRRIAIDGVDNCRAVFDELETLKKKAQKKNADQNLAAAKAALRGVITQTENEQRRGIQKRVVEADEIRSVQKGDRVRLLNVGGVIATVLAPADRDGGVQVQAGPMKMTVKENELRLVEEKENAPKPKPQPRRDAPRRELNIRSAESEVDVRGMSAEEALFEVDNFLSRAIMAGLPSVTVIHGKGTGVLRTAVQQHLRKNKRVKSVRSGVYGEGEQGVTIVELR